MHFSFFNWLGKLLYKLNIVFAYPFALTQFTIPMTFQGREKTRARNKEVTHHHNVKGSLHTHPQYTLYTNCYFAFFFFIVVCLYLCSTVVVLWGTMFCVCTHIQRSSTWTWKEIKLEWAGKTESGSDANSNSHRPQRHVCLRATTLSTSLKFDHNELS